MSDLTKEDLLEALDEALNKRRAIENDVHEKHHDFIQMEIERRERSRERWNKFQLSFIGGLALSILGFLGWIGSLILDWVRSGGGTTP